MPEIVRQHDFVCLILCVWYCVADIGVVDIVWFILCGWYFNASYSPSLRLTLYVVLHDARSSSFFFISSSVLPPLTAYKHILVSSKRRSRANMLISWNEVERFIVSRSTQVINESLIYIDILLRDTYPIYLKLIIYNITSFHCNWDKLYVDYSHNDNMNSFRRTLLVSIWIHLGVPYLFQYEFI